MEMVSSIALYSNKKQMEDMAILGVPVGTVDVRLIGLYDRKIAFISDLQEYLLWQIEERADFPVKTESDVKAFLEYLKKKNTTFPEWMHGWMKKELLERKDFDYNAKCKEWDK